MFEPPKRKLIHISDTPPDSNNPQYCGWIDTTTRTVKVYENGQWIVKASFAEEGYTGEIKAGNKTFTFSNGILKSYE